MGFPWGGVLPIILFNTRRELGLPGRPKRRQMYPEGMSPFDEPGRPFTGGDPQVQAQQLAARRLGLYYGPTDGVMGENTLRAIREMDEMERMGLL